MPVSVNPSRLDDSAPDLSAASMDNNLLAPVSANPPTPDILAPESGAPSLHNDLPPESETPQLHNGLLPESGTLQLHNDLPPESGTPQLHDDLPPQADKFFNDALKKNIMIYAGLGTIVGVSVGLVYGVHKLVKGTGPPQAYVSFPARRQLTKSQEI